MSWLDFSQIEVIESIDSTQDELKRRLAAGEPLPSCLLALDQIKGRGRFGREWSSAPGDSLTMTIVLPSHPKPWLFGFMVAAAAAGAFHTRVRWPNDLTIRRRKVGGVLTEVVDSATLIGIGVNLNHVAFPEELEEIATSLAMERGTRTEPLDAARRLLERLEGMDRPESWADIAPIWTLFDDTPGKLYKLPTGESATALGLGPSGELLCAVDGETTSVMAAEALFG